MHPIYFLRLTHPCTVNILTGSEPPTQIYLPDCKAGHILARGQLSLVRRVQDFYARHGYGTDVVQQPPQPNYTPAYQEPSWRRPLTEKGD